MSQTSTATQNSDIDADEEKFAHYAESASVTEGYILGKLVLAICGESFIPSRDPLKLPICPKCKELAESLMLDV